MPLDSSYLYRQGANGQTRTVSSQRNRVYASKVGESGLGIIGVLGEFKVQESRKIDAVRGIGFGDQIAELVPGNTDVTKINITRTALYLQNLMQSFGYKAGSSGLVRSLKHHKWPFDIRQEVVFSELVSEDKDTGKARAWTSPEGGANNSGDTGNIKAIFTIFEGCWMDSYDYTYSNENTIVAESCGVQVSDIFDGNDSVYGMFIDAGLDGRNGSSRSQRFS